MKVRLLEPLKGRGEAGDVIDVARGFAVNYLFPRRIAERYTPPAECDGCVMRDGCGVWVVTGGVPGCVRDDPAPWLPGQDGKRCPLRQGGLGECYQNQCAWYMDVGACAVPVLVSKLDKVAEAVRSVDDTLLGYDQRGLLVRARTE